MIQGQISFDLLCRGAAALAYIRQHGNTLELTDRIALARAERRQEHLDDGWQRQRAADDVGHELARLTGVDKFDCIDAAKETFVGSDARLVLDEIVDYARQVRDERQSVRNGDTR